MTRVVSDATSKAAVLEWSRPMADQHSAHLDPNCDCENREDSIHISRRTLLKCGATAAAGVAGAVVLTQAAPIDLLGGTPQEQKIVKAYDEKTAKLTFIVDSSACIGCGLCVSACKEENRIPEETEYNRTWIERHVRTSDGVVHVDSPEAGVHGFGVEPEAPGIAGKKVEADFFLPRLCMQCENPPCVSVCPVSATYSTPEGIVLIDASRCIGCGYCVTACPYGARYVIPDGETTPLGASGVADKCTWCFHRITRGIQPACVEVCPVDARQFGNAADPDDPIHESLAKLPQPLWPEYGTVPRLFQLGPITEEV